MNKVKAGDKVICIKNFKEHMTKGNMYEVSDAIAFDVVIFSGKGDEKFYFTNCFDRYFITLAEWRNEQINSILND